MTGIPPRVGVGLGIMLGGVIACAKPAIAPPHPIFEMEDRVRSRTNIIPLIVDDRQRAEKVVRLYEELEQVAASYRTTRAVLIGELASLEGDEPNLQARIEVSVHGPH